LGFSKLENLGFLRATPVYRQVLLRARISYGDSVCPFVRLSVCGVTTRTEGEIETPGFHRMVA